MDKKAPMPKNEEGWKKTLTPEQYRVLREKGTEAPFSGKLLENKEKGIYMCSACGNELFSSDTKFDSGTGWPSFYKPLHTDSVKELSDDASGMHRVEIVCGKCGGHLGHVFPDGPGPTGMRYCMNSVCLAFDTKKAETAKKK